MTLSQPLVLGELSAAAVLCLSLAHFLWQGTIVVLAALLVGAVLRQVSSHAQYAAQLVGLLLLPAVFVATLAWYGSQQVDIAPAADAADLASAIETVEATDAGTTPVFLLPPEGLSVTEGSAWNLSRAAATAERYSPLVSGAYLTVVALMALRLALALCGANRLARESAPIDEASLLESLARQCRRLGMRTIPAVAYCRDVSVPTVIGILRPTVLLPLSAMSGMTAEEIETILLHELVHIRRYDHLFLLVQRLMEVLFFFHPAVWVLSRRISDVREHCCDDRVIALGTERHVYVESLLRAAELSLGVQAFKEPSSLAVALSAVDNPSRLRQRVLRLLGQPLTAPTRLRTPSVIALMALLAVIVAAPVSMRLFAQTGKEEVEEVEVVIDESRTVAEFETKQAAQPQGSTTDLTLHVVEAMSAAEPSVSDLINAHLSRDDKTCMKCHSVPSWRLHFTKDQPTPEVRDLRGVDASGLRGRFGEQLLVQVEGSSEGSIWGTDVYTDDSRVDKAAVHAGLVKPGEKAILLLTIVKSPAQHAGTQRNGVQSQAYGSFPSSFMLSKPAESMPVEALPTQKAPTEPRHGHMDLSGIKVITSPYDVRSRRNAVAFRQKFGRQFNVEIVGRTDGSIWGTDVYTDDSDIATAAVHAGLVKPEERAIVTVTIVESPDENIASEQNGVKSSSWSGHPSCYILTKKSTSAMTAPRKLSPETAVGFTGKLGRRFDIEVVGRIDGSVWGTDVYTDDSNIATAAVHAGLVKPDERALLTLTIVESPDRHEGSTRNGVTSRSYGSFSSSFILQRKSEGNAGKLGIQSQGGTSSSNFVELVEQLPPDESSVRLRMPLVNEDVQAYLGRFYMGDGTSTTATSLREKFGERRTVEVVGREDGSVWGTGVYTDDSDIATAAVHAGLVKPGEKAALVVTIVKSPEQYKGSEKNGVTSRDYGAHPSGFVLHRE